VSGRNSFSKLRANIDADPERRARMDEKRTAYDVLLRLSELSDLRRERGLTQAELAEALSVSQPAISKLEAASSRGGVSGSDMLLSTLAGYIESLGGRLELHATFPGHPEEEIAVPVGATSASPDAEDAEF
jgi:transcriptional regulator with XRE-family HTH domain